MIVMRIVIAALALLLATGPSVAGPETGGGELAPPVRIEAAGAPINVDVGHSAPFVVDWNRDGKPDLLVGQFGQGKLRIYLNRGTAEKPTFGEHEVFEAGGAEGTVPSG
jgi:hypothetical protein